MSTPSSGWTKGPEPWVTVRMRTPFSVVSPRSGLAPAQAKAIAAATRATSASQTLAEPPRLGVRSTVSLVAMAVRLPVLKV